MARTPLYKAAEAEMIRRIETGTWEVGLRLPNEFVLAEEFRVSQGTMRRALMTLEGMGLLHRKPGRGTIVTRPEAAPAQPKAAQPAAPPPAQGRLMAGGAPFVPEVHRAKSGLRGADPEEAALFGTRRLVYLQRLLKRAGDRAALEEVVVPERAAPALDEDGAVDLAELLEDHGLGPATITDEIGAAVTTMAESVALACDRHAPLLVVTRTARDAGGRAVARQVLRVLGDTASYA
ncbi:GntR family transcriptional regulator [Roseibacterium sp. SDUM158017]|uniref:GntR family transcriptional regulator n=1 Tax=Roseicyclus salinarum TaxID=3036773 RepID=UPI0024155328|nr:GntR family transcriptional regulator [Roseibacterium sp. SDUM158017]MDG4649568.1 GntR family transcriptional regulator [Roseibacterium sp. SDUM158017]